MSRQVDVGEFVFCVETGELRRRTDVDGAAESQRLPPQPAVLLSMLVDRAGEVVSREEIRERLWPDVTVDYEQGLHFCVRQVRSALGDSADAPEYIETLPRRGYRLIADVNGRKPAVVTSNGRIRGTPWVILLVVAVFAAGGVWLTGRSDADAVRLAIMPFDPPENFGHEAHTAPVAELLLSRIGGIEETGLEIIGPTTTLGYVQSGAGLKGLIADYDIDYFINARFATGEEGPFMLAELIRGRDGAHIWVERFVNLTEPEAMTDAIIDGAIPRLIARE